MVDIIPEIWYTGPGVRPNRDAGRVGRLTRPFAGSFALGFHIAQNEILELLLLRLFNKFACVYRSNIRYHFEHYLIGEWIQ